MTQHPAYGVLRPVTENASVLLCENPSEMTLDGTNTWVLRAPGSHSCVVVDPGPLDEEHLQRVAACGPVAEIVLTHGHEDHAGGAHRFAELVDAPVLTAENLADGNVLASAGLEITVLATPGHTEDSLSLLVGNSVLTGDTILGRGTTVISDLGDYLGSLRRLSELPAGTVVLPGHGPELPDASGIAREYLAHREQRLAQVRAALEKLGPDATARQVVEVVYADVDQQLWWAAEWSVRSQLEYLRKSG